MEAFVVPEFLELEEEIDEIIVLWNDGEGTYAILLLLI